MAEILFLREMPIRTFYWRRFSRIFPAYAALIVILGMLGIINAFDALTAFTFTANYLYPSYLYPSGYIDHIWSLCVEEHSYLILGVVAYSWRDRFSKETLPTVLLLLAAAMMTNGAIQTWIFHRGYYDVYWHSDVRGASVLISAGTYLLVERRSLSPWIPVTAATIGLATLIPGSIPDPIKYTLGTSLLAIGICTMDAAWTWVRSALSIKPLCMVGLWSFSLYLWQQPYFLQLPAMSKPVLLVATFATAIVSYYAIERPARSYLNSLKLSKPHSPRLVEIRIKRRVDRIE